MYDIPVISARAAFWHSIALEEEIKDLSGVHVPMVFHERFACLIFKNWFQESTSIRTDPVWRDVVNDPPVFGGDTMHCKQIFEASSYSGTLEGSPSFNKGWLYYADVPEKYGYISQSPNSTLTFDLSGNLHQGTKKTNKLFVHYMRSYSNEWGTALIEWVNNDSGRKGSLIINSKTEVHESQLAEAVIELGSATQEVQITNINGKVKIMEIILEDCDSLVTNCDRKVCIHLVLFVSSCIQMIAFANYIMHLHKL